MAYITISYFSFYGKPQQELEDFKEKNAEYYYILPPDLIKEYDFKIDLYENKLPALIAYENIPKVLLGKSGSDTAFFERWEKDSKLLGVDLSKHAVETAKKDIFTDKIDGRGSRIVNKEEITSLYALIDLLKSRNMKPVLVTTPYLREYKDNVGSIDAGFYSDFKEIIERVCKEKGVVYYDYSSDERFMDSPEYFIDTTHLNRTGARKFANVVREETVND